MNNILKIVNIKKSYVDNSKPLKILYGIDMDINKGEITTIIGPSGAGKSTLLHIMGLLDRPDSGDIVFKNKSVFSSSDDELSDIRNREFGFIFQFHHLLSEFSAIENIMIPLLIQNIDYSVAMEKAKILLKDMGLINRQYHKPMHLSGGERQRVAIARALVTEPMIIFADEPTGNLDRKTGKIVFNIMYNAVRERGIALVIVTHDRIVEKYSNKIAYLVDGKLQNHYYMGIEDET
ncbi:ABC transporter ATP-binding protein [candidate division WOR-3 bacterium]|jgi:lipoprotein-releasing system ATP-binding protein|nr:ABC transporter ATP-binding protein [candidate division WOR-3 bacterium]